MTASAGPVAPPPTPKVDPESLAIRSRPAGAIRIKRGALIGITALASASLMTIAWIALKPMAFHAAVQSELSEPNARTKFEAIDALPTTYSDVPKLGPPLPGDLGRPILRAQQSATVDPTLKKDVSLEGRIEKRVSELKAARESGLMVQVSAPSPVASRSSGSEKLPSPPPVSSSISTADEASVDRKSAFVATIDRGGDLNPHRLEAAMSPYSILAGSIVAASLITGLSSDLPGIVTAQITEHVYDSISGSVLLIPQGSRLLGAYDHVVAFGQKRALVIWQRLILPNGQSVRIDNMPATDPSGYAGLADKVDFHTWALLKGVAIATLLGVSSELSIDGESNLVEAIRESTQQNVSRAGDQLTSRNLDVQPTITVRPGTPVRLIIQKDLILAPWRGEE